ncbi:MAG: acyltransferase [Desulfofustis sp.]|nr:acyltransferase [Desulfofustis sp.]
MASDPNTLAKNKQFFSNSQDFISWTIVSIFPQFVIFDRIKSMSMRWRGARIGTHVRIWQGVWFDSFDKLSIGNEVTIGQNAIMVATGGLEIGDRCMIGHGSMLLSANHIIPTNRGQMRYSGLDRKPVLIKRDSWVGAGAVILPGVVVGEGAVVASGGVVSKDVPDYAIVGGVPASLIRMRD